MPGIKIQDFGGILPRRSERLLPDNAAQICVNYDVSNGELVPLKMPSLDSPSTKAGPLPTIHRIAENGAKAWLTWPYDVDVVKAPLYGTAKWCYTGDGEPRITNMASATAGAGFPYTAFALGTPTPETAPTVTPSGGVSATMVDRIYLYTFYASWDGVEFEGSGSPVSALVNGKIDATWGITAMNATPPNSGDITALTYVGTEVTITTTNSHFNRVGDQITVAGVTTVTNVNGTWKLTAINFAAKTMKFSVTATPTGTYNNGTDTTDTWTRKAAFPGTIYKRIYRTTGTTGQFQLVVDQKYGGTAWVSDTAYNDSLSDSQIPGDEYITAGWVPPPADLHSLIVLDSGALAGLSGNKVFVSEPYQPHAFPSDYAVQLDHVGVGMAPFGSNIGVATESAPAIIIGTTPGQMSLQGLQEVHPCLSKRSVISLGDQVAYSSAMGLISLSLNGVQVFTLPYFTEREWVNYNPATMVTALANRRLYVLYDYGTATRMLGFNLLGDNSYLTEAHIEADDLHADSTDGNLYFSFGSKIYRFNPLSGYNMTGDWMGKEIVMAPPKNIGAAKVSFNPAVPQAEIDAKAVAAVLVESANAALIATGNVHGAWGASAWGATVIGGSDIQPVPEAPPANVVTFMYYAGGVLVSTRAVPDRKPFSLPSGYKRDRLTIRVSSNCQIESIELADTKLSLAQA